MTIKITSVLLGALLLIAGILMLTLNVNVPSAYSLSLIGFGGYFFGIGLSSIILTKMFYKDKNEASALRNKALRLLEIVVYSVIGILVIVSTFFYFTILI